MSSSATHTYLDINQPSQVKYGQNVGNGQGLVYESLSGTTLNFRKLQASGTTVISTIGNNVIIYTPVVNTTTFLTIPVFNNYTGNTNSEISNINSNINFISGKTLTKSVFNTYTGNTNSELNNIISNINFISGKTLTKSVFNTYTGNTNTEINGIISNIAFISGKTITSGKNLGGNPGLIYDNNTGNTLNFRTLKPSGGTSIITQGNNIIVYSPSSALPVTSSIFQITANNIASFSVQTVGAFDNTNNNPSSITNSLNWNGIFRTSELSINNSISKAVSITNTNVAGYGVVTSGWTGVRAVNLISSNTGGTAVYAASYGNSGYGLFATTPFNVAAHVEQSGNAGSINVGANVFEITRTNTATGNINGNIINIIDNPSSSFGFIGGSVLSATIGATVRLNLNPRVVSSGSAVAYMFDSVNNLNTTGDKLLSIRNNGSEKFSVDKSGNVEIPLGSSYMINNIPIGTYTSPIFSMTGNTIKPFNYQQAGGFDNNSLFPSSSNRLNYNGDLYANTLTANVLNPAGTSGVAAGSIYSFGGSSFGSTNVIGFVGGGIFSHSGSVNDDFISVGSRFTFSQAYSNGFFFVNGNNTVVSDNTNLFNILRESSSGNTTGNIINIVDAPTTTGTISGSLMVGTIGSNIRLNFNPRVTNISGNTAYFIDTDLNLTGHTKLLSIRNKGTEQFSVDKSGNVNIPTGANYMINNIPIGGLIGLTQSISPYNTFLGYSTATILRSSGGYNVAAGYQALSGNTSGQWNTAMGAQTLTYNGTGYSNTAVGESTLYSNGIGFQNTGIGTSALYNNINGNKNTAVGYESFSSNITGSGNVGLGYYSGYNETGNNQFYLNNVLQSSIANDRSYSLMWGTFSGTQGSITGQQLTINGVLNVNGASINASGTVNIPTGQNYEINGVPIGGMTNPMTTIGDIIIGGSSGTPTRYADIAAGSPFISGGIGVAPAYAGYKFVGTASTTYTFPSTNKTLAANDGSNISLTSQTIGDLIYASSTTAFGRIADVASGSPLISGGVGVLPAYAGYKFAGTAAQTYTFPTTTKTLSANDGSNLTLPSQAVGDILYANSTSAYTRLGIGSSGQILTVNSGKPAWETPSGSGTGPFYVSTADNTTASSSSPTQIVYNYSFNSNLTSFSQIGKFHSYGSVAANTNITSFIVYWNTSGTGAGGTTLINIPINILAGSAGGTYVVDIEFVVATTNTEIKALTKFIYSDVNYEANNNLFNTLTDITGLTLSSITYYINIFVAVSSGSVESDWGYMEVFPAV